jgi:hypothetical protein
MKIDLNKKDDQPIKVFERKDDELKFVREESPEQRTEDFPDFSYLEYELYDKKYKIDLTPLLKVSNQGLEGVSAKEIDEHLERIAAFRHSVATLKELINKEYVRAIEDMERWQSQIWGSLYEVAINRRRELKERTGSTAGWFGSITKEELRGLMLIQFEEEYKKKRNVVNKYQTANNLLGNLLKILEDRGSQIQTILKRREGLRREI